jgi:hypothetical protein
MTEGFGMNFYGFFLYAGVWVVGYFLWAIYANRKEGGSSKKRDLRD